MSNSLNCLDITTNPLYSRIPRLGKFLVTFKYAQEFDPLAEEDSRIIEHDVELDEFYLVGGYSMQDLELIEPIKPLK